MSRDPYTDALTHIKNSDFVAKQSCSINISSTLLLKTLEILKAEKYIDNFELKTKSNKQELTVKLNGSLTNLKSVKPRYPIGYNDMEKYEKRYLPSRNVGLLILSTPQGLRTHVEAKKEKIGGRLIAFVY
jgi:small subunit ribosomal protein S8